MFVEYIFLVDRSGSMYGAAMEGVKKALQVFFKNDFRLGPVY